MLTHHAPEFWMFCPLKLALLVLLQPSVVCLNVEQTAQKTDSFSYEIITKKLTSIPLFSSYNFTRILLGSGYVMLISMRTLAYYPWYKLKVRGSIFNGIVIPAAMLSEFCSFLYSSGRSWILAQTWVVVCLVKPQKPREILIVPGLTLITLCDITKL